MAPMFSRALAAPVLRPLAERLCEAAGLSPDDRLILDAPCDGGVLSAELMRAGHRGMRVVGIDADGGAIAEAVAAGSGACFAAASPARLPLPPGRVDSALSLLTLPHQADPAATLAACAAVLHPSGRLLAAVWAERRAVPHLAALEATLRAALGRVPAHLEEALSLGEPGALEALAARAGLGGVRVLRLRDVVRFEGADHLWAAHCAGPLGEQVAALPAEATQAARDDLAGRLLPVTAWDATLLVPVELAVLTATPG